MKTTLPIRWTATLALAAFVACIALADPPDQAERKTVDPSSQEFVLEGFSSFKEPLAGMDWTEEADRIRLAAENLWKRNGWTDEADRFAREVGCEIAAIPPWDVMGRFNLLTTRVTQRYGLSEEAAKKFRGSLMREAGAFLGRHGRVVIESGKEALAGRARGEPYTPEQVAKWAKMLEPLLVDMEASADRLLEEIKPSLDPEHKRLFDLDVQSLEKRARYLGAMRTQWSEGKWRPTDWGLETDPIQNRPSPLRVADPPALLPIDPAASLDTVPESPVVLPNWQAHDPTTWFVYVLQFGERFGLDTGQKSTAESIHGELVARAADYSETHRDELHQVPMPERETNAAYEPIRALFAELQARLDALPTTVQRQSQVP